MAELAGSIIGIVSAGTKVALVLSQLAADVGSAGHEARMIGSEIRSFCAVLKTLGDAMEKIQASPYYNHCFVMIQDMREASLEMFTEILDATEHLKRMAAGKDGKDGKFNFSRRVQWVVFQKPKVLMLRAAIEAYKSNLALMLCTLSTTEKVARHIPLPNYPDVLAEAECDRTLLKSLELDHRASLIELEQAERQYEDYAAQSSVEIQNPVEDTESLRSKDMLVEDSLPLQMEHIDKDLFNEARLEVESIRSSLSMHSAFDSSSIQDQVARHSQRLSSLLEEPQRRLSQRWSTILSPQEYSEGVKISPSISPSFPDLELLGKEISEPSAVSVGPPKNGNFELFRWWFLQQTYQDQINILEALQGDVASKSATKYDPKRALPSQSNVKLAKVLGIDPVGSRKTKPIAHAQLVLQLIQEQAAQQRAKSLIDHEATSSNLTGSGPFGFNVDLRHQEIDQLSMSAIDTMYHNFIVKLSLSWNRLTSIPENLSLCTHLQSLDLGHNSFERIPKPILHLSSLEVLDMRQNQLKSIPDAISSLKSLKVLSLANNNIQGIPFTIAKLKNLHMFNCVGNPVIFPPPDAVDLTRTYMPFSDGNRAAFYFNRTVQLRTYLKNYPVNKLTHKEARAISGKLPLNSLNLQLGLASPDGDDAPKWPHLPRGSRRPATSSQSVPPKIFANVIGESISTFEDDSMAPSGSQHSLSILQKDDLEPPPRLSIPRIDSPTISQPSISLPTQEHRKSRSYDETTRADTVPRTGSASPLRPRSYIQDATPRQKRYSTMFLADSSTLGSHLDSCADDAIQKYMDSVHLLSPPPLEKSNEPLQPPLLGSIYRTR